MSSSKNLDFEKTSFLNKSNSAFIEQMYLKFLNKDPNLPEGWANYFEGIGEEINVIANEINGPSWSPKKNKIDIDELQKKIEEWFSNKHPEKWTPLYSMVTFSSIGYYEAMQKGILQDKIMEEVMIQNNLQSVFNEEELEAKDIERKILKLIN